MKSIRLPLAAIFFMTYLYRAGVAMTPSAPPYPDPLLPLVTMYHTVKRNAIVITKPCMGAVCGDSFDTPSGLHRYKYTYKYISISMHSDLKFICETSGDRFPFTSQLKDHRSKHLMGRGFTCFAKNCGRSFKNRSSLTRHLQVHSGKLFYVPN